MGEEMAKRQINLRGSLTIEASLSLTLFMFAVILLAVPMQLLDTQRRIQMTLEAVSREMSQYAYITYKHFKGEAEPEGGQNNSEDLSGLFEDGALQLYLAAKLKSAAGEQKISSLNLTDSNVSDDGEVIDLRAEYRLKLPFTVFTLDSVPASSRSFRRGWIGSDGGRNEAGKDGEGNQDIMVYVGKNESRYHLFPDCHYISNDISTVSYEQAAEQLSSSGTHYKPCSVCGSQAGPGNSVYIMPNGKYYHSRPDCSSIAFYVRKVPLSEVEHLGECSYCRRKGQGR